ncbi:MAG TPA: hypothetical protein VKZ82_28380 [Nonomuraea sp.]|nr:hypothetical protein [Nonomuraea sp.]
MSSIEENPATEFVIHGGPVGDAPMLRPKRGCNGCGKALRDATQDEINAALAAHAVGVLVSMNDVRPECPDCGATVDNEEGQ